jgi:hypothetical protein
MVLIDYRVGSWKVQEARGKVHTGMHTHPPEGMLKPQNFGTLDHLFLGLGLGLRIALQ